jgi:uncharacterized protein involved in cysteine biosynthesis
MLISGFRVASSFLGACHTFLASHRLKLLYLRPYVVGFVTFVACATALIWSRDWTEALLFTDPGWMATMIVIIISLILSSIISVTCLLSSAELLLGSFLVEAFRLKGISPRVTDGNMIRSFAANALEITVRLLLLTGLAALSITSFFFPPLAVVTWLLGATYLGCDLIVSPLSALGVPFREQWSIVRSHKTEVLLSGMLFSLVLVIPLGGLFLLPIGYLMGVEKITRWRAV